MESFRETVIRRWRALARNSPHRRPDVAAVVESDASPDTTASAVSGRKRPWRTDSGDEGAPETRRDDIGVEELLGQVRRGLA